MLFFAQNHAIIYTMPEQQFYPDRHSYCLWALRTVGLRAPWRVGMCVNVMRVGLFRVASVDHAPCCNNFCAITPSGPGMIYCDHWTGERVVLVQIVHKKMGGRAPPTKNIFAFADGDAPRDGYPDDAPCEQHLPLEHTPEIK